MYLILFQNTCVFWQRFPANDCLIRMVEACLPFSYRIKVSSLDAFKSSPSGKRVPSEYAYQAMLSGILETLFRGTQGYVSCEARDTHDVLFTEGWSWAVLEMLFRFLTSDLILFFCFSESLDSMLRRQRIGLRRVARVNYSGCRGGRADKPRRKSRRRVDFKMQHWNGCRKLLIEVLASTSKRDHQHHIARAHQYALQHGIKVGPTHSVCITHFCKNFSW